jgi:hypothetical protein
MVKYGVCSLEKSTREKDIYRVLIDLGRFMLSIFCYRKGAARLAVGARGNQVVKKRFINPNANTVPSLTALAR